MLEAAVVCIGLNGAKDFTVGQMYQFDSRGRLIGDDGLPKERLSFYQVSAVFTPVEFYSWQS